MKTPESTIKDIMSLINDGEFVHIKCSDHSEKFLHKCGDIYRISTDRLFRSNVTELRNPDDVAEHLEEIRGHGTYAPDDITPIQEFVECGCGVKVIVDGSPSCVGG